MLAQRTIVSMMVLFSGCSATPRAPRLTYYSDGRLASLTECRDTVPDGLFVSWYPSGEIKEQGEFTNGFRTGRWTSWHNSRVKSAEATYRNNHVVGVKRTWYANGQLSQEREFRQGLLVNEKAWHSNGQLGRQGEYEQEAPHGEWCWWDARGKLLAKGIYRRGEPWSGTLKAPVQEDSDALTVIGWGEFDNGRLLRRIGEPSGVLE